MVPGKPRGREHDDARASVAGIGDAIHQAEVHALIDELAHRLLAHRRAPGEFGQPGPFHIEISGQAHMSNSCLDMSTRTHEFEDPGLKAAHRVIKEPADIGVPPRRS